MKNYHVLIRNTFRFKKVSLKTTNLKKKRNSILTKEVEKLSKEKEEEDNYQTPKTREEVLRGWEKEHNRPTYKKFWGEKWKQVEET